jgi:predicted DNA-binding transcriptional regulator AlpA
MSGPGHATRHAARSPLLTEADAAAYLSLTRRALQAWRYQGRGPRYVKISARAVRYRPEDLESWIETRLRSSTSDPGHE